NRVRCKHLVCSLDLHVLGTPPAFVLSQDQTLHNSERRYASHNFVNFIRLVGYVRMYAPSFAQSFPRSAIRLVTPNLETEISLLLEEIRLARFLCWHHYDVQIVKSKLILYILTFCCSVFKVHVLIII